MRDNPRGIESLIRRAVTGTRRAGWITRGLGLVAVVGAGLIVGTHLSGVARASPPAVNTMPVAKAALFSQQNAALAKAKQHPFPKTNPADYKPPASATPAPRMVGIVVTEQSPLPGMQFLPNHVWTAPLKGGTWVEVWTGEQEIPKVEGAVYVMTFVRAATGQFSNHTCRVVRRADFGVNVVPGQLVGHDAATGHECWSIPLLQCHDGHIHHSLVMMNEVGPPFAQRG